ncbi:hypothetical protein SAMN02799624_00070 [Paenibacillus sp. UNC496MF]|uniref:hypothetical protein n=1 Tax=Paenibacillus sp. UNC496MF TaxID=1502753 RepID=UPI0008F459AC|nr:hypothetical protein [Paenibacillus sp. UNC496MF]SFI27839.1 hypothetical protein SAMN02799624_00070 [Paenibacillus sp. UNC496MF]
MNKWTAMFAAVLAAMLALGAGFPGRAASAAPAASAASAPAESALRQHVRTWTDALSKQPAFRSWTSAERTIAPLGPGTHGWLVTFAAAGKPVGYMIVNATPEGGYRLGEYGVGAHPAFYPVTLYNALIRQGLVGSYAEIAKKPLRLERLYLSPVLAAWKWSAAGGETYYLDAWTGEAMPVDDAAWQKQSKRTPGTVTTAGSSGAPQPSKLTAVRSNRAFDPFERMPWLTSSPLSAKQVQGLAGMLDKLQQIRYTAELFNASVLQVLPAVGYHGWNGGPLYVAFDQAFPGTRYVPVDALDREGHFYR